MQNARTKFDNLHALRPAGRWALHWFAASAVLCLSLISSCASGSETTAESESSRTKQKARGAERESRAPAPEQLEESPCGNPDWAEMPEGHRIDGDPDEEDRDDPETSSPDAGTSGETKP